MRKRLSILMAMASIVILVFALNLGVAFAHPDASDDGVEEARLHAGTNPPLASNGAVDENGDPVGGLVFNPATADMGDGAVGTDAMDMQIAHSPVCGPHALPGKGVGPGH